MLGFRVRGSDMGEGLNEYQLYTMMANQMEKRMEHQTGTRFLQVVHKDDLQHHGLRFCISLVHLNPIPKPGAKHSNPCT